MTNGPCLARISKFRKLIFCHEHELSCFGLLTDVNSKENNDTPYCSLQCVGVQFVVFEKIYKAYLFQIAREKSCDNVLIIYMKKYEIASHTYAEAKRASGAKITYSNLQVTLCVQSKYAVDIFSCLSSRLKRFMTICDNLPCKRVKVG